MSSKVSSSALFEPLMFPTYPNTPPQGQGFLSSLVYPAGPATVHSEFAVSRVQFTTFIGFSRKLLLAIRSPITIFQLSSERSGGAAKKKKKSLFQDFSYSFFYQYTTFEQFRQASRIVSQKKLYVNDFTMFCAV